MARHPDMDVHWNQSHSGIPAAHGTARMTKIGLDIGRGVVRIALAALVVEAITGVVTAVVMAEEFVQSQNANTESTVRLIDADQRTEPFFSEAVPRSQVIAADLNLNHLCCVGHECWAVGDRGSVCYSADSGSTWTTRFVPYECSLHSVCFLSNRHGWIAGTQLHPERTGFRTAVLLQTRDGGLTWRDVVAESQMRQSRSDRNSRSQSLPLTQIPGLLKVQFFGLEEAIAITLPTESQQSGTLFRSLDGGLTWNSVTSDHPQTRWTNGVFLSASEGMVAGEQLAHATLVSNQAVTIGPPTDTLRGIHGLSASADGTAWMVGDGCFVLTTHNGGVSWQTVELGLSVRHRQLLDLHTVAQRQDTIIAAGSPATCLLRSADQGQTWQRIQTNQSGGIRQLVFTPEGRVLALASLGAILQSDDDGQSWQTVKSPNHRAGILNLITDRSRSSFELLAENCADAGIRTVAVQLAPDDTFQRATAAQSSTWQRLSQTQATLTAQHALNQLAVNGIESEWMFPRNRPEHHLSAHQLIAEWNRQTDGQLRDLLPLRLARLIRMWKPTVIAIEPAGPGDQVATLLGEILPAAIQLAAAEDHHGAPQTQGQSFSTHDPLADLHLIPWSVQRVVTRCSETRTSPLLYSRDTLLKTLGTTTGLLTRFATTEMDLLTGNRGSGTYADRVYYESVDLRSARSVTDSSAAVISVTPQRLFDGLQDQLGPDARRHTERLSRDDLQNMQRAVQAAHTERSALIGHLKLSPLHNALEAELQNIGTRLPPTLALQQLQDLAALNRQSNNIDGWIAVQQEIIRRFPTTQAATQAATFLFTYYSSAEVRRYRVSQMQQRGNNRRLPGSGSGPEMTLGQDASATLNGSDTGGFPATSLPFDSTVTGPLPNLVVPASGFRMNPRIQQATGVTFGSQSTDHGQTLLESWDRQAATALQLLNQNLQLNLPTPVILRQAANLRLANRTGEHSTLLAEISGRNDAWSIYAQAESQAVHGVATPALPIFNLRKALHRPWLDATLADDCWVQADEIPLTSTLEKSSQPTVGSFVMMSWDDEFLYVAGRFEFPADGPAPESVAINRTHDADHGARDRVELRLDVDRDYATAFHFSVDQSGQTSERCDLLTDWNPEWFAAVDKDQHTWRIELAIPLHVLDLQQTRAGDLWTISVRRILPGHFEHAIRSSFTQTQTLPDESPMSWTGPQTIDTALIRFIRPNRKKP